MLETFFFWIGYSIMVTLLVVIFILFLLYCFDKYQTSKLKKFFSILNIRRKIKILKYIDLNNLKVRVVIIHKKGQSLEEFMLLVRQYLTLKNLNYTLDKPFPISQYSMFYMEIVPEMLHVYSFDDYYFLKKRMRATWINRLGLYIEKMEELKKKSKPCLKK